MKQKDLIKRIVAYYDTNSEVIFDDSILTLYEEYLKPQPRHPLCNPLCGCRLLVDQMLPEGTKDALYLDADTIVLRELQSAYEGLTSREDTVHASLAQRSTNLCQGGVHFFNLTRTEDYNTMRETYRQLGVFNADEYAMSDYIPWAQLDMAYNDVTCVEPNAFIAHLTGTRKISKATPEVVARTYRNLASTIRMGIEILKNLKQQQAEEEEEG